MRNAFSSCHPAINLMFFTVVIGITVFFLHPVILGTSLIAAMIYSIYLGGVQMLRFNLILLPLLVVAALVNPLFNHQGITILFYWDDNPITLESIRYGICAAAMIGAVILWFSCFNRIMTLDKFSYLFAPIIPALSLIIAMALRFIPSYQAQLRKIAVAQRGIGKDVSSGDLLARIRNGLSVLSIMVTWALENAVETSDSMVSRGYGLKGHTAYPNYRFTGRDVAALFAIVWLGGGMIAGIVTGVIRIEYFPDLEMNPTAPGVFLLYGAFAVLCFLPLLMDIRQDVTWRILQSKI